MVRAGGIGACDGDLGRDALSGGVMPDDQQKRGKIGVMQLIQSVGNTTLLKGERILTARR